MKKYLAKVLHRKFAFADNAYNIQHMGSFFKVHFIKTISILGGDQINYDRHNLCHRIDGWNLNRSLRITTADGQSDHMIRWFGTVLERLRSFCGFLKFLRLAGAAFCRVIIKVLVKVVVFFSAPPPGSIRDKIVIFANLPLFTNDEITLVKGPCSNCVIISWKAVLKCINVH